MPNLKKVNLTGEAPIAGLVVNISGHVEPGQYTLSITNLTEEPIKDKPGDTQFVLRMAVVDDEVYQGTPILDRFSVPSASNPSTVGMQRFHHFLIELGMRIEDPEDLDLDFDKFAGRRIDAILIDDQLGAYNNREARTISRVERYVKRQTKNVPIAAAAAPVKAKAAMANGTATAVPARAAKAPATPPAPLATADDWEAEVQAVPAGMTAVEDEVDETFPE